MVSRVGPFQSSEATVPSIPSAVVIPWQISQLKGEIPVEPRPCMRNIPKGGLGEFA